MQWTVTQDEDTLRVGDMISKHVKLSSEMLKFLKYREDGILVNGERSNVRRRLRTGDVLSLTIRDSKPAAKLEPVNLPLDILYEDDDMVFPAKPAGMPTHPSHNHQNDTVANALAYRYASMGIPFVFRPINRLDRDTSGVLLIARNKLSAGILTDLMKAGEIHKTYLAVLKGDLYPDHGIIDKALHRTAESIIVRETCPPDAPDADLSKTEYQVLARCGGYTLVEAKPLTGRTHQLRVHFASIGNPIVGDTLYGPPSKHIGRQALHAKSLTLPLPSTKEELTVTAPVPDDMKKLISHCFPAIRQDLF